MKSLAVTLSMAVTAIVLGACAPMPASVDRVAPVSGMDPDCSGLIRALANARARPQVAQYLVDANARRIHAQPRAFRINDLVHESEAGAMAVKALLPGQDLLADALIGQALIGNAWCRVGGAAAYGGKPVTRIEFRHPELEERFQPATVLIDPRSWVPVWHGYAGMVGGYAWDYEVYDPAAPGVTASLRAP
ncbi:MAG: hypothetical protein IPI03_00510 [Rubrivivax sp.]|nr:hypothetical protein [Rubrivivax sp.]MBK8526113.1 hypothetical protein [Rubrivivax sp.]